MILKNGHISIWEFFRLLISKENIELSDESINAIAESRKIIDSLGSNNIPVYGVTTGFGEMINRLIPNDFSAKLQKNLIRTHATGIGQELDPFIVRAIMITRLITFSKGHSGISLNVVSQFLNLLNEGTYPVVHSQGSLGASGDLSPLAELALGIIGESNYYQEDINSLMNGFSGIYLKFPYFQTFVAPTKINLSYKEGLSLINGTAAMTAITIYNIKLARQLIYYNLIGTAMSLVALKASSMPFDYNGISLKGHDSMTYISDFIQYLIRGSSLIRNQDDIIKRLKVELDSGKEQQIVVKSTEFLQNAYSLRCIPQVTGGLLDILSLISKITENELNGIDDNPITVTESKANNDWLLVCRICGTNFRFTTADLQQRTTKCPKCNNYVRIPPHSTESTSHSYIFHGAHFHGQYIGYANDWLKIPLIQIAQLADRRVARLIDSHYNEGLTDLLAADQAGLSCAFEGLQYTSTSIVAEMKSNGAPASIQSIPSNLNNQDLVSMGMIAARQVSKTLEDAVSVIAVEIRTALQAMELRIRKEMKSPLTTPSFKEKNGGRVLTFSDYELEKYFGKNLTVVYKYLIKDLHCEFVNEDRYLATDLANIKKSILDSIFYDVEDKNENPIMDMVKKYGLFLNFLLLR